MKWLAGLQVVLGTLAGFISVVLSINKRSPHEYLGLVTLTPAPNHTLEAILVVTGVVILGLALALFVKKIRFSTLQIISDLAFIIAASVLYNNAGNAAYEYSPGVYWLVFVAMAAALLVAVTGILQLFRRKTPVSSPA